MADLPKPPPGAPASDPSEHRRAWDAIPWVVAGSAAIADVNRVMHHLPHCASCREEFEFQQRLHRGLRDAAAPEADPEPGLQRLMARIEAANTEPVPTPRLAGPVRWLAAAVVVQAVGLAAAGFAWMGATRDAEFRTLSTPEAPRTASLRLVPAAGMDFAALRGLLAELKLDIVDVAPDGSSLGLAPADGQAATAQAALPRLRGHAGVQMAEPTGHGPR
jgi:hypothetical protein